MTTPATWSYSESLATDRDKARFFIQDTNSHNKLLSDGEVDAMISIQGTPIKAAIALAEILAARYASSVSMSVDGLSVSSSDRMDHYLKLAERLRVVEAEGSSGALGIPSVFGISQGEMDSVDSDSDRTPSKFKMGQDENAVSSPDVSRI